jgi:hypothetical protein
MLYCLYPEDILKRKEVEKILTMEDVIIENYLRQYSSWAEDERFRKMKKEK